MTTHKSLEEDITVWRGLEQISEYQRGVFNNWTFLWNDWWQRALQMAPTNLCQSILPWNFSCIQFTREIKGNPALESKILTEVAGYGSQMGTMMDVIEVMARKMDLKTKTTDDEDLIKRVKFEDLLRKINKAKERHSCAG